MRLDADRIAHDLERLGHDWADKNAAAQALEDAEKSVLAEILLNFRATTKARSEAEDMARASRTYRDHVAQAVEARRVANKARVSYDVARVRVELERTNASTDRAAMQLR